MEQMEGAEEGDRSRQVAVVRKKDYTYYDIRFLPHPFLQKLMTRGHSPSFIAPCCRAKLRDARHELYVCYYYTFLKIPTELRYPFNNESNNVCTVRTLYNKCLYQV